MSYKALKVNYTIHRPALLQGAGRAGEGRRLNAEWESLLGGKTPAVHYHLYQTHENETE